MLGRTKYLLPPEGEDLEGLASEHFRHPIPCEAYCEHVGNNHQQAG